MAPFVPPDARPSYRRENLSFLKHLTGQELSWVNARSKKEDFAFSRYSISILSCDCAWVKPGDESNRAFLFWEGSRSPLVATVPKEMLRFWAFEVRALQDIKSKETTLVFVSPGSHECYVTTASTFLGFQEGMPSDLRPSYSCEKVPFSQVLTTGINSAADNLYGRRVEASAPLTLHGVLLTKVGWRFLWADENNAPVGWEALPEARQGATFATPSLGEANLPRVLLSGGDWLGGLDGDGVCQALVHVAHNEGVLRAEEIMRAQLMPELEFL